MNALLINQANAGLSPSDVVADTVASLVGEIAVALRGVIYFERHQTSLLHTSARLNHPLVSV